MLKKIPFLISRNKGDFENEIDPKLMCDAVSRTKNFFFTFRKSIPERSCHHEDSVPNAQSNLGKCIRLCKRQRDRETEYTLHF